MPIDDKTRARAKRYRQRHPERERERHRRYSAEHPEVGRAYQLSHKFPRDYYKERKGRRATIRDFIHTLKAVPCVDCRVSYPPCVMDFDHRPGTVKLFNVSRAGKTLAQVTAEAAKCDVVCSNCHRLRTWGRAIGRNPAEYPFPETLRPDLRPELEPAQPFTRPR